MKKLLIFLIIFFSSLFILMEKSYAYSYEDVTFNYDSIDFISLYNEYEIVEHIKEIVDEYNTHNFPVIIYFIHDENNANYLDRIGFGVDQRTINSNTNFYINNFLREISTPFVFTYDEELNTTNKICYFTYYGVDNDDNQLCRFRTNLTIDSYTQSDLNNFYTNIQKMLTQYVEGQTNITKGGVTPHYTTNINTQSYNIYDQSRYQAYVWSNVDLINKKGVIRGYTNYITNTYFGDDLVPFDNQFISYDTYINSLSPTISFTYNSYSNNNEIYKGVVHIDFGTIDNTTYIYQILKDNGSWVSITPTGIYNVDFYNNGYVSARIIERATGNIVDSNTFNVTGIISNFNIDFSSDFRVDINKESTGIEVAITYFSNNENNYIYAYDIFTNSDMTLSPKQIVTGNAKILYIGEDSTITGYIYDISDTNMENSLYSKAYSVNGINPVPKISFSTSERYVDDYKRITVLISYGNYNPTKYRYYYSWIYDYNSSLDPEIQPIWHEVNSVRASFPVETTNNALILAKVEDLEGNTIDEGTFYVTGLISGRNENLDDIFSNIVKDDSWQKVLEFFGNIWTELKKYRLHYYILLIITTSIIIVVMKHIKK